MNDTIQPGRYRHFKGGEYEVIDLALHSETEQPHVVYRPLYGQGRLWIRPLELFQDRKLVDGRSVPRFERIADPDAQSCQAQLGDTLFALLCLANDSGVNAEEALEQTLERYRQRIERAGHAGSGVV